MATWQEDIAANLAFIRADSGCKDSRTVRLDDAKTMISEMGWRK